MRNPVRSRWPLVWLPAAIGALLLAAAGSGESSELAGVLVRASGPVEVRPLGEGAWRAAALRAVLQPGDMLRTGRGAAAEVAFLSAVIHLDENTVIILPPPRAVPAAPGEAGGFRLLLYRGRALFRLLKDRLEGGFDVITPSVIAGVKGTTFGVEERAQVGIVVFDGSVQVVPAGRPGASPVTVESGQFSVLARGQLTPPQPFQPAAVGGFWSGGPTGTQSAPLPSTPGFPGDRVSPSGRSGASAGTPGASAPALERAAATPPFPAAALDGAARSGLMSPPRLAVVGGPPSTPAGFALAASTPAQGTKEGHGPRAGRGKGKGDGNPRKGK